MTKLRRLLFLPNVTRCYVRRGAAEVANHDPPSSAQPLLLCSRTTAGSSYTALLHDLRCGYRSFSSSTGALSSANPVEESDELLRQQHSQHGTMHPHHGRRDENADEHPHHRETCIRIPSSAFDTTTTRGQPQQQQQQQQHQDWFRLFQLPYSFDIDLEQLKQSYWRLMSVHHPDKHPAARQQEPVPLTPSKSTMDPSRPTRLQKENAHAVSGSTIMNFDDETQIPGLLEATNITQAYETLKFPYSRAKYLLSVIGPTDLTQDDELVVTGGSTSAANMASRLGFGFLEQMMTLHETIDEASQSQSQLRELFRQNRIQIEFNCEQLSQSFAAKDWDRVLQLIAQLQYWNRIHDRIKDQLE